MPDPTNQTTKLGVPEERPAFRHRLSTRHALFTVLVALAVGFVSCVVELFFDLRAERARVDESVHLMVDMVKEPAGASAYAFDNALAQRIADGVIAHRGMLLVEIDDDFGSHLAYADEPPVDQRLSAIADILLGPIAPYDFPLRFNSAKLGETHVGDLRIVVDGGMILAKLKSDLSRLILSSMVHAILLATAIAALIHMLTTIPLLRLARGFAEVEPERPIRQLVVVPPGHEKDELGGIATAANRLIMAFQVSLEERDRIGEELRQLANDLEKRVDERTAEVLGAKELAETALETLRQAQERLVQAEKMASLGNLVAGVAHELNTPLGNMLMVSTTLQAHIADFNNHVRQGTLQRSILDNFLNESLSATNILTREAEHAAELIGNFKQVAIDQSSLRRRKFDLGTVVKETLSSLHNKLKNTVINIEIDIPSGIIMDNHPGPIEQILTNFILNSLLHGFDEGQPGSIRIEARAQNGQLYFVYEDSGHGMNEESAKHAFDPFFTTKFGQGGSGLGLYIVYNLVTTVLMGRLTLSTRPGAGTRFDLNCPLDAPADVSSAALVQS